MTHHLVAGGTLHEHVKGGRLTFRMIGVVEESCLVCLATKVLGEPSNSWGGDMLI